jgi:hypothetical protein
VEHRFKNFSREAIARRDTDRVIHSAGSTVNRYIGEIVGEKKRKPGEISAERALAEQKAGLNEEMLDDAEQAAIGDVS